MFAQAELCSCFMDSKCSDKGNVHEFLDELRVKKEKLATYGVVINDKNYHSTIITSLPYHLSNFALSLLANARLHSASQTIDSDQLIALISEEHNHNISQRSQCLAGKSSKADDKDEAMLALSSGKVKQECKPCDVCWNCGEKGHFKDKCPKPAKDRKNNSPKKSGSAHAAVESNSEDGAAFLTEDKWESDSNLPNLITVSDSDSDADSICEFDGDSNWFSKIGDSDKGTGWESEELFEADGSECGSLVSVDLNSVASDLMLQSTSTLAVLPIMYLVLKFMI
jgi:gag-polypeptide of LTR copia-type/Zinc knuckle